MNNETTQFLLPPGRYVGGSIAEGKTTDSYGQPLKPHKDGSARTDYYFAVAIPKGPERHWAETAWGQKVWAVGHQARANAGQLSSRNFAWKVIDGDSAEADSKGKAFNARQGYPGNWVVQLNSSFPPKVATLVGLPPGSAAQPLARAADIKPGYFVEVLASAKPNTDARNPGVFLGANAVCWRAYGPEINLGMDVSQAGFGQTAAPAGAMVAPPAAAGALPPIPGTPLPPAATVAAPLPPAATVAAPLPPAATVAAPLPPADSGFRMPPPPAAVAAPTLRATGQYTIDQLRQAGYSTEQMIAGGYAARV